MSLSAVLSRSLFSPVLVRRASTRASAAVAFRLSSSSTSSSGQSAGPDWVPGRLLSVTPQAKKQIAEGNGKPFKETKQETPEANDKAKKAAGHAVSVTPPQATSESTEGNDRGDKERKMALAKGNVKLERATAVPPQTKKPTAQVQAKTIKETLKDIARGSDKTKRKNSVKMETTARGNDNMKKATEENDNKNHSAACPCALCGETNDGSSGGRRAIYVLGHNDTELPLFTGIVRQPDGETHLKLNDPSNFDIENASAPEDGHVMDDWELMTELSNYPGDKIVDFPFGSIRANDEQLRSRLMDFSAHPYEAWYERSSGFGLDIFDEEEFFPFPNKYEYPFENPSDPMLLKKVRALDAVMLISPTSLRESPDEAFWATVLSVTSTGIVTAQSRGNVPSSRLQEDDFLTFPIWKVLGFKKGINHHHHRKQVKGPHRRRSREHSHE